MIAQQLLDFSWFHEDNSKANLLNAPLDDLSTSAAWNHHFTVEVLPHLLDIIPLLHNHVIERDFRGSTNQEDEQHCPLTDRICAELRGT